MYIGFCNLKEWVVTGDVKAARLEKGPAVVLLEVVQARQNSAHQSAELAMA